MILVILFLFYFISYYVINKIISIQMRKLRKEHPTDNTQCLIDHLDQIRQFNNLMDSLRKSTIETINRRDQ